MRIDYHTYDLTGRQKLTFLVIGYLCIFVGVFLFFHSFIASAPAGLLVLLLLRR